MAPGQSSVPAHGVINHGHIDSSNVTAAHGNNHHVQNSFHSQPPTHGGFAQPSQMPAQYQTQIHGHINHIHMHQPSGYGFQYTNNLPPQQNTHIAPAQVALVIPANLAPSGQGRYVIPRNGDGTPDYTSFHPHYHDVGPHKSSRRSGLLIPPPLPANVPDLLIRSRVSGALLRDLVLPERISSKLDKWELVEYMAEDNIVDISDRMEAHLLCQKNINDGVVGVTGQVDGSWTPKQLKDFVHRFNKRAEDARKKFGMLVRDVELLRTPKGMKGQAPKLITVVQEAVRPLTVNQLLYKQAVTANIVHAVLPTRMPWIRRRFCRRRCNKFGNMSTRASSFPTAAIAPVVVIPLIPIPIPVAQPTHLYSATPNPPLQPYSLVSQPSLATGTMLPPPIPDAGCKKRTRHDDDADQDEDRDSKRHRGGEFGVGYTKSSHEVNGNQSFGLHSNPRSSIMKPRNPLARHNLSSDLLQDQHSNHVIQDSRPWAPLMYSQQQQVSHILVGDGRDIQDHQPQQPWQELQVGSANESDHTLPESQNDHLPSPIAKGFSDIQEDIYDADIPTSAKEAPAPANAYTPNVRRPMNQTMRQPNRVDHEQPVKQVTLKVNSEEAPTQQEFASIAEWVPTHPQGMYGSEDDYAPHESDTTLNKDVVDYLRFVDQSSCGVLETCKDCYQSVDQVQVSVNIVHPVFMIAMGNVAYGSSSRNPVRPQKNLPDHHSSSPQQQTFNDKKSKHPPQRSDPTTNEVGDLFPSPQLVLVFHSLAMDYSHNHPERSINPPIDHNMANVTGNAHHVDGAQNGTSVNNNGTNAGVQNVFHANPQPNPGHLQRHPPTASGIPNPASQTHYHGPNNHVHVYQSAGTHIHNNQQQQQPPQLNQASNAQPPPYVWAPPGQGLYAYARPGDGTNDFTSYHQHYHDLSRHRLPRKMGLIMPPPIPKHVANLTARSKVTGEFLRDLTLPDRISSRADEIEILSYMTEGVTGYIDGSWTPDHLTDCAHNKAPLQKKKKRVKGSTGKNQLAKEPTKVALKVLRDRTVDQLLHNTCWDLDTHGSMIQPCPQGCGCRGTIRNTYPAEPLLVLSEDVEAVYRNLHPGQPLPPHAVQAAPTIVPTTITQPSATVTHAPSQANAAHSGTNTAQQPPGISSRGRKRGRQDSTASETSVPKRRRNATDNQVNACMTDDAATPFDSAAFQPYLQSDRDTTQEDHLDFLSSHHTAAIFNQEDFVDDDRRGALGGDGYHNHELPAPTPTPDSGTQQQFSPNTIIPGDVGQYAPPITENDSGLPIVETARSDAPIEHHIEPSVTNQEDEDVKPQDPTISEDMQEQLQQEEEWFGRHPELLDLFSGTDTAIHDLAGGVISKIVGLVSPADDPVKKGITRLSNNVEDKQT
ncbi:hypothetical protein EJ08DRAFT_656341 [Tothia fuscella]|uniref:Uncharacterized protein n=1 Tax=Tothia fuscella TaxID=1048955 RepID=A0A9P4U224_9PEZI|nr:hypothetical protein EJ08DRAFT_656341 [Tothia fuscella]